MPFQTFVSFRTFHAMPARAAWLKRQSDGVSLKEYDFPWLAEIAHRFSNYDVGRKRVDEFMARQAMLFEPDIALNFHLLRYQELLKPRFQTR